MNDNIISIMKTADNTSVVMAGPLSKMCADILNTDYKKEIEPVTGISLETQALDSLISKSAWLIGSKKVQQLQSQGKEVGFVYSVNEDEASMSDVVEVSDILQNTDQSITRNSAIVLNNTDNKKPSIFSGSIRDLSEQNNVKVYSSIRDYAESLT